MQDGVKEVFQVFDYEEIDTSPKPASTATGEASGDASNIDGGETTASTGDNGAHEGSSGDVDGGGDGEDASKGRPDVSSAHFFYICTKRSSRRGAGANEAAPSNAEQEAPTDRQAPSAA